MCRAIDFQKILLTLAPSKSASNNSIRSALDQTISAFPQRKNPPVLSSRVEKDKSVCGFQGKLTA